MSSYSPEFRSYILELIEKSLGLVDSLGEQEYRKELSENIQNIFTASKLEGQLDIVIYSEYLYNVSSALVTGGLVVNSKVISGILESLKELETKIKEPGHPLNTSMLSELTSMLKNSYKQENDFIIVKKIKVLLIDKDRFLHFNLKKNGGDHITFDPVSTIEEATEKLQNSNYDLILCDFNMVGIAGLFSTYSTRLPLVVLSNSDSTRDAQLATRMGAVDYIIKNDDGMKLIQRTLHTAVGQWKRKNKERKKPLLNQQSRQILKQMLESSSVIKERYDSNISLTDNKGENLKTLSRDYINNDRSTRTNLENLVSSKFLTKYPTELTIACPTCQSVNFNSHYICQNCNSSDFVKGEVIEHNKCGYTDLSSAFEEKSLDKLICPKCNKELKLIGVDYFRLESAFKCRKCHVIFSNPYQIFDCNECDLKGIKYADLGWKNVFTYSLSVSKISEIKQQVISLEEIENYIANLGFKVNTNYLIQSNNQTLGPFDVVALKEDTTIVINSLGDDVEENFSKLFELNVIDKVILGKIYKIALLFSEPKEVTKNLIDNYNIQPIIIEDISKLYETFKGRFSKILLPSTL